MKVRVRLKKRRDDEEMTAKMPFCNIYKLYVDLSLVPRVALQCRGDSVLLLLAASDVTVNK